MPPPALTSHPHIPPSLLSHLHTELTLLSRLRAKNAAQHRSGLFFRRVGEVERVGWGVEGCVRGWKEGEGDGRGGTSIKGLDRLLMRLLPALVKATDSVQKMIHHLHFLPLTTVLLAIYARLWHLALDLRACIVPSPSSAGDLPEKAGAQAVEGNGVVQGYIRPYRRELEVEDVLRAATTTSADAETLRAQDARMEARAARRERRAERARVSGTGGEVVRGGDARDVLDLGTVISRKEARPLPKESTDNLGAAEKSPPPPEEPPTDQPQSDQWASPPLTAIPPSLAELDADTPSVAEPTSPEEPPRVVSPAMSITAKIKKKKRKDPLDEIFALSSGKAAKRAKGAVSPAPSPAAPAGTFSPLAPSGNLVGRSASPAISAVAATAFSDSAATPPDAPKPAVKISQSDKRKTNRDADKKLKKKKKKASAMDDIFGGM